MTSVYIDKTNFSDERAPANKRVRERISSTPIVKTYNDSTFQISGIPSQRKTRFQNSYAGIDYTTGKPTEIGGNKEPLSYQNDKFEDDNVRFLSTGERKRRSNPSDRVPRNFELATQRIQRLNVYPDGVPRSGIFGDIGNEQKQNSEFGKALTDLQTVIENGIPIRMPGMSDADFKTMLESQYKTKGAQMVFSEADHAKAAAKEAADRRQELSDMIATGNFDRLRMIEDIRKLQELGDITKDQFDTLIDMTSNLGDENVKKEAKKLLSEKKNESLAKREAVENKRQADKIDEVAQKLEPVFAQIIKDGTYDGTQIEMKGDDVNFKGPLSISGDTVSHWIDMFLVESERSATFKFENADDLKKTMDSLETVTLGKGPTVVARNREKLALYGILRLLDEQGRNPTFREIETIQRLASDNKDPLAKAKRKETFDKFWSEIDKNLKLSPKYISPASTPVKSKSGRKGSL